MFRCHRSLMSVRHQTQHVSALTKRIVDYYTDLEFLESASEHKMLKTAGQISLYGENKDSHRVI